MTAPPNPPRVGNHDTYWSEPPPEPSPRLVWWLDRIIAESWEPNRRISAMGYDEASEWYGIYIWECQRVLRPLLYGYTMDDFLPSALRSWLDGHGLTSDWVQDVVVVHLRDRGWVTMTEAEVSALPPRPGPFDIGR